MRNKSRLDRVFARLLQNHPYGWALYKKATAEDLRPGCCGYFDVDGDWHTLVDLMGNPEDLIRQGWKAPGDKFKGIDKKPETLIWGPKQSKSVVSFRIGGEVGIPVIVAPIEPSVNLSFTCEGEEGAVLAPQNPVLRNRIGDEMAAMQWMQDNTAEILRQYRPIVERHGVWIVTKTCTARRCGVAVMTSKSSKAELGFGVSAPGLFTLKPSSSWTSNKGDLATEIHEDEKGVVAFVSGIYFSKKLFSSNLKHASEQEKQRKKIFRGGYEEGEDENEEEYGQGARQESNGQEEEEEEEYGQGANGHGQEEEFGQGEENGQEEDEDEDEFDMIVI
ncbi:hypothetical protein EDB81DRAFT_487533 [Dactylonectria macrodidyma]|uniref:Uncharacterized protein n=1 Tax=Dactylonectria macrodidyma TaxID=307937 RepID=A0A9P9J8J6_9HYPO|nr:hypothetical protein EDB81DRAFT_487533 [Dactylonectria macrodidyma]